MAQPSKWAASHLKKKSTKTLWRTCKANQTPKRQEQCCSRSPQKGLRVQQQIAEIAGFAENPPKHQRNRWRNPQKRLQFISKHS